MPSSRRSPVKTRIFATARGVWRLGLFGVLVGATRWVALHNRATRRVAPTSGGDPALCAMTGLPSPFAPFSPETRGSGASEPRTCSPDTGRWRVFAPEGLNPRSLSLTAPLSGGLRTPGEGYPCPTIGLRPHPLPRLPRVLRHDKRLGQRLRCIERRQRPMLPA